MGKKTTTLNNPQRSWRLALIFGIVASILSLMLGLLLQTIFYEIASAIPSVIRQDSHVSLPLCKSFPDLYGCDAWVGKWTSLEIWKLSLQVGKTSGLLVNLILVVFFSALVTIREHSDSVLPGLLTGTLGGFSTLILALVFDVSLTIHSIHGIFGILMILGLPLSGLSGATIGIKRFSRMKVHRSVFFLPREESVQLDEIGESLSKRELEVLALVASGYKNTEIAQRLYISKATVKTHLQHIYVKMRVKNRTAAVTQALACGWLCQEDDAVPD
jgi:DNA-binding CsgD family transcriptional regulator